MNWLYYNQNSVLFRALLEVLDMEDKDHFVNSSMLLSCKPFDSLNF